MTAHGDEVRRSTGAGPSFSASPALPKPHRCADSKSSYALPYPPQTARRHNIFSFGHTFSDYPWHHHEKQKKAGVPNEQCFLYSWEYLIYMSVAKILLNMDNSQPHSDVAAQEMSVIETFVIDTHGSRDPMLLRFFPHSVC